MPHNKKPAANKNKKKGGRKNNNKGRSNQNARSTVPAPNGNDLDGISLLKKITNLPTFHKNENENKNKHKNKVAPNEATTTTTTTTTTSTSTEDGGYYEIYKRSTTNFWDWMKQACPNSKNKMTSVNDLRKGAEEVLEHNYSAVLLEQDMSRTKKRNDSDGPPSPIIVIVAPAHVMDSLSTSIRYREMFTSARFGKGGGDEGHRYITDVLRHCRSVLKFGRDVARVATKNMAAATAAAADGALSLEENEADVLIGGRFNALVIDDEEDEDEDEDEDLDTVEGDIRDRNFPRFTAPEVEEEIDIQKVLINGDDRFQAMALLHTMDDLMGAVEHHYGLLKNQMRGPEGGDGDAMHQSTITSSNSIQLMMECTVAANMATESVQAAENALMINHPHLSSFYHVLALVFLPELVADVENLIHNKAKLEQEPHMALKFVADIAECSFHNQGDNRIPARVKRFAKKSGIQLKVLEKEAEKIHAMTSLETQLALEETLNAGRNAMFAASGFQPHMWLQRSAYIGGDCCILNTQNIVQKLMGLIQDNNTRLTGKPGFWGPHFNEDTSPTRTIRGGLDEPFASCIMPELIEICKHAPFHCLPERSHLITVLDLMQQHIKGDRTRPVPIALSFGLHAILTSIFVLQGNGDLARIASYSKRSYNTLFAQLDDMSDPSKPPHNAPIFYANVGMFKQLVNFAKPVSSKYDHRLAVDPSVAEKLAFWNPLIGGEYMLYGTYMCSIGMGSATVDSLGQLRFALHLYNALKQRDPSLDVPFLRNMDAVFDKTKAVWIGGRPEKGSYCKHFWMAWGMGVAAAARKSSEHVGNDESFPLYLKNCRQQDSGSIRDLDEIRPEEYSASYRRLVQHIFADEDGEDHYTMHDATKEAKKNFAGLYDLLTHVNITRDAMDGDEDYVLPVNFSAVGCILLQFVNELSENMGWSELISHTLESNPEMRSGKTMGGRRITGFTASELNFKHQGMAHFWAHMLSRIDEDAGDSIPGLLFDTEKVATFMIDFFSKIPRDRYTFFVETEEQPKPDRRNPLEGSYPYGKTGKTMRDPLEGIFHLKYNKKGQPSPRMITPGFHTPATTGGAPPYEGGFNLRRGPSGKYRHIASYNLDELMALGWDGALYTATRSRHAASGHYVPFIAGYDSDSEDEYEPIDIQSGKRAGTIGLSAAQNGLYMTVPSYDPSTSRPQLVQIKNGR